MAGLKCCLMCFSASTLLEDLKIILCDCLGDGVWVAIFKDVEGVSVLDECELFIVRDIGIVLLDIGLIWEDWFVTFVVFCWYASEYDLIGEVMLIILSMGSIADVTAVLIRLEICEFVLLVSGESSNIFTVSLCDL
ncbi:MAG: hypothetical protein H9Q66_06415 [Spiroplasma ixodetis]|nr:hypothetical protein [Spiroplasma ixodetis]